MSLSARRAWIEILKHLRSAYNVFVALRKESVDRNYIIKITRTPLRRSLSARRAWIEMSNHQAVDFSLAVALRKESVDRNMLYDTTALMKCQVALRKESVDRNTQRRDFKALGLRRSPQGERG